MAEEALLRLRAKDETKAAFASVKQSVDGLRGQLATLGVGLSVGGFAAFLKGSIDLVASLDDLSERTSLSVGFLSQLQQTARIGGHDLETIADAASKFTKSIGQAEDKTSEQAKAFQALGINLRNADGSLRKTEELFVEFAQVMTFADNKSRAFAAAMPIIGRSAAQLQPVFADIAKDGLRAARVTEEQAEAAEKLQKQLAELGNAFDAFRLTVGNNVVPVLDTLLKQFNDIYKATGNFAGSIRALASVNLSQAFGENAGEQIKRIREELEKTGKLSERFPGGIVGTILGLRESALIENLAAAKALQRELALAGRTGPQFEDARDIRNRTPDFKPRKVEAIGDQDAAVKAAKENAARLKKLQEEEMRDLVKGAQEIQDESDQLVYTWDEVGNRVTVTTQEFKEMERTAKSINDEVRKLTTADFSKAWGAWEDAAGGAEKQFLDTVDSTKQLKEAAADMGVAVTGAFADAIVEGEKFSGVLKGLLKDILRILAQKFIVEKIASGISGILGSVFSGIFGSAGGGPISAGRPRLVGEQGPEIFVPDRSGMIVPNQSIGGGVTVNVNVSAGVAATVRSEIAQMLPAIQRATTAGVADSRQRGNAALRG